MAHVADDHSSSDEDSNDNSEYTVPFKVLGVQCIKWTNLPEKSIHYETLK